MKKDVFHDAEEGREWRTYILMVCLGELCANGASKRCVVMNRDMRLPTTSVRELADGELKKRPA